MSAAAKRKDAVTATALGDRKSVARQQQCL